MPPPGSGTGASVDELEHLGPPHSSIRIARMASVHGYRLSARSRAAMTLTVVGSIAFDAVETPAGSATGCSAAPPCTSRSRRRSSPTIRVVGPVGDDFGDAGVRRAARARRRTPTTSSASPGGKTFFWAGRYERDVNVRDTLQTDLNVFERLRAEAVGGLARRPTSLFLANIQPGPPARGARAVRGARASSAMDSMNLWIDIARDVARARRSRCVDCLILNDAELKQLTDEPNLVRAAREALEMGPRVVSPSRASTARRCSRATAFFALPAYPTADGRRPDGRGRHLRGRLHRLPRRARGRQTDDAALRRAMAYGTALASFNVEEFGTRADATRSTADEIAARVAELAA